jgi:hypothetical protein
VLALLLLGGMTACSGTDGDEARRERPPTGTATPTGTGSSSLPAVLPAQLVGAWASSGGDATLAYRFVADGRYRFAGLLTQPRAGGTFEFTRIEAGTARVDGRTLILRPSTATSTRKDPDDPAGDFTDRPAPREIKRYTWSVAGNQLVLIDGTGQRLTLDRQPS